MHHKYITLVQAFGDAAKHAAERADEPEIDYCELSSEVDLDEVAGNIDLCDLSQNICLSELTDHIEIDDRIYSAVNDSLLDHVRMWFGDNQEAMECAMRNAVAWHFETRSTPWRRFVSAVKRRWYSIKARFKRSKEA